MGDSACSVRVLLLVAALSALSLLVLTTMILSILIASGALAPQQGVNGCSTCGASTDAMGSSSSEEYIEMLRTAVQESIQLLNTSFQSLANLDQGAEGPRGYNGSVGEEGPVGEPSPMATHGNVSLYSHCHTVVEQCLLTSSQRSCSTPAVQQSESHFTHYCMLNNISENAMVKGATLASYVSGMRTFHYCLCDAVISQGFNTHCQYSAVMCDWSNVNVTLVYP